MKKLRRVLPNSDRTRKFLESLPAIYIVGCWARYGVWSRPFAGAHHTDGSPLVYDYDDHNGTTDNYYLRPVQHITTGSIYAWTTSKTCAERIAAALNAYEALDKGR